MTEHVHPSRLDPGPTARGAAYSCDAMQGLEVAEVVANKVGDSAAWYSVGVLSQQEELCELCAEFCDRRGYAALFHPVDLDICGTEPLDHALLRRLGKMADRLRSPWLNTDLAMWCRRRESLLETLIPMPLIDASIPWTVDRIKEAQDVMGHAVAIENPPYFYMIGHRDVLEMMNIIAHHADCYMTVDVGHLYGLRTQRHEPLLSSRDDDIDWSRVVEVHMSGSFHRDFPGESVLVDDKHAWSVAPEVWQLAQDLLPRAKNLRAVLAEAEGAPADELATSVIRFASAYEHWQEGAA